VRSLIAVFTGLMAGALGFGLGGCGGSGTSGDTQAVTAVTRAAYVTSEGPGFRMLTTVSASIGGDPSR